MNQSFKSSLTAGVLALAIITTALPTPCAYAQTNIEDLLAQIQVLQAQLQALQSQTGTQSTVSLNLTRNLSEGMTGSDVLALQQFLNSDSATVVAQTGVGSKGNETTYFGSATKAAVVKYQNKYQADILAPVGLAQGTGFVGASTRAHMNARATVTNPTVPTTPSSPVVTNPTVTNPTETPSQPASSLQGEGDLKAFEIDAADDDTIREASADSPIAVLTLEADDGDLVLTRLDISLVADSGNTEKDPWDTFENISLWIDDGKVVEQDIDTRSDFLDRTTGTVRISGLNIVLEEDEEVEIVAAVTVQNNVKGAGVNADWSVTVTNLRYKDSQNVVTTDTNTGDLGNAVDFSIVERGDGEELTFKTSTDNPQERTIVVDDKNKTNNVTILGYSIEAQGNDIELDTLYVNVQTGSAAYSDVVSDIRLKIGNDTFKKDKVVLTGDYKNNSVLVSFDINKQVTIDEDEAEDFVVLVDLKSTAKYANGETIQGQVTSAERDLTKAEGADDVESFSGSIVGKVQTLADSGLVASPDSFESTVKKSNNAGTMGQFTLTFAVTAIEDDFFVANRTSHDVLAAGGLQYRVIDTDTDTEATTTTQLLNGFLTSTARKTNNTYVVREGQTEEFTLIVTVDPTTTGWYQVVLDSLQYSTETDGINGAVTASLRPVSGFTSTALFITN